MEIFPTAERQETAPNARRAWYRLPWAQNLGIVLLTFTGFFAGLWLFLSVMPTYYGWAVYWPFNGILTALLLMSYRRRWPFIAAAAFASFACFEYSRHEPLLEIAVDCAGDMMQALLTAFVLPPFRNLRQWILEPSLVMRFVLGAVLGAPGLSCLPVVWYFHRHYPVTVGDVMLQWGLSDALGATLWIPLVLVLMSGETYDLFRWRALPETLGLLMGLSGASWLVFHQQYYPIAFLPYPLLLLLALRLGFSGAVMGANLLAVIVVSLSLNGHGPLRCTVGAATTAEVSVLQVFCMLSVILVFPLSITLIERSDAERRLQEAYAEMTRLATVDKLTGLPNRRQFDQRLETEWKRAARTGKSLGLLMIDVDFFKAYNDLYGHVAGDECLQQVAALLSSVALRQHDLRARYGGEEFAVLLPEVTAAAMADFAEHIRATVYAAHCAHAESPEGRLTVSVGCALSVHAKGMPYTDLVIAADRALYAAKHSGRNRVFMSQPEH